MKMRRELNLLLSLCLLPLACSDDGGNGETGETSASSSNSGDGDGDATSNGDGDGDGDTSGDGDGDLRPNWHQDVAPVVHGHCVSCHQPGGVGPFSLVDYDDAAQWAPLMVSEVEAARMPPWGAAVTDRCQPEHGFRNDPSLDAQQRAMAQLEEFRSTPGTDDA